MNRKLFVIAGIFLLAVALPGVARAERMVLEIDPQKFLEDEAGGPKKCDNLHQTTGDCKCCNYHVVGVQEARPGEPGTDANGKAARWVGARLELSNVRGTTFVRVDRVTPLYRLDSGATFTPAGAWNPYDANGERWESEYAGLSKSRVVSAWNDLNGDGLVGVADELVFDNGELAKIVNVGIGIHVTTEQPARSEMTRRPRQQQ